MSFEKYADLADTGFQGGQKKEAIAPEDEFFHSIYIAGKNRKNHINVVEENGKIQIRGVQYNLEEAHMIITHTKEVLCKVKNEKSGETVECFSFKDGSPPWYGTSRLQNGDKRVCPTTSAERAVNSFCNPCRAQIIVGGIYCKANGEPILTEEKKPIFVFLRGKGMRYSNVSEYLGACYNSDYSPLFEPVTEKSKAFEKAVVNNKRCVTKLTKDEEQSNYGSMVNVFVLSKGTELPKETVHKILDLSNKTLKDFNSKFDWSQRKETTGYGGDGGGVQTKAPEGIMTVEDTNPSKSNEEKPSQPNEKIFSFDDINF